MSKTKHPKSNQGKEWWGKRPLSGHGVSLRSKIDKRYKRLLHKIERREGKKEIGEYD